MKKSAPSIVLLLVLGGLAISFSCKSPDLSLLSTYLPQSVGDWEATGEDRIYDSKTIFEYINRASEVYRAFDFQQLLYREFIREGYPKINVDFFDMGTSANAFGIFSFNPDGEEVGIGQGSTYKGRLLVFWKDRFFVSVSAGSETEGMKEALLAMGQEVASGIENEGEIPSLVSRLPKENLVPRRVHYFFNPSILNYFTFLSGENILRLGEDADAVLGRYREEEAVYSLLLVQYSEKNKAQTAKMDFMTVYLPEVKESGPIETENGTWMGVRVSGNLFMILWNAPTKSKVEELFLNVK